MYTGYDLIFGRGEEIFFNFLGNLAFLPVYVLFVTLMIERVLKEREREAMKQKLNMVIGVFFSEVGTTFLRDCTSFVSNYSDLSRHLKISAQWNDQDFDAAELFWRQHETKVESRQGDLQALKDFLILKRGFMLTLMENPNLLEHDAFTDLLWAVFHLIEELEARNTLKLLPAADLDHLSGDIKRAYVHLVKEWIVYMRHLNKDYPYLYSLAVRTNPMNPDAKAELN
jgi:hypothetical protein